MTSRNKEIKMTPREVVKQLEYLLDNPGSEIVSVESLEALELAIQLIKANPNFPMDIEILYKKFIPENGFKRLIGRLKIFPSRN